MNWTLIIFLKGLMGGGGDEGGWGGEWGGWSWGLCTIQQGGVNVHRSHQSKSNKW